MGSGVRRRGLSKLLLLHGARHVSDSCKNFDFNLAP